MPPRVTYARVTRAAFPQGPPAARIDAPGNIGTGTLDGIEASLQLPLGRLTELDAQQKSSSLDVIVETSVIQKFTVRLTMLSILDDAGARTRKFYTPDRAGSLSRLEDGRRRPGFWWLLSVTGSLGSL